MSRSRLLRFLRLALLLAVAFSLGLWAFRHRGPVPAREDAGPTRVAEVRLGVMGTRFGIEVDAPDEKTGRAAIAAAYERIHGLEQAMSTYIESSTLSLVNREAADHPVKVDPDTFEVLVRSREYFELSGGAFDPTVGPLILLWRPLSDLPAPPSDAEIAAARALVGFGGVTLDAEHRTVAFAKKGMRLDLGGIAKGYAADEAAKTAIDAGATAVRINAGGDLTAVGRPHWNPRGFEVEIRNPSGGEDDALPGLEFLLLDRAVATSGNYERYTRIGNETFSHIMDPRTGRPVPNAVAQVTVLAPDGTASDALATTLTVLGPEAGCRLAGNLPDVEALFLVRDGHGGYRRIVTPGFPETER